MKNLTFPAVNKGDKTGSIFTNFDHKDFFRIGQKFEFSWKTGSAPSPRVNFLGHRSRRGLNFYQFSANPDYFKNSPEGSHNIILRETASSFLLNSNFQLCGQLLLLKIKIGLISSSISVVVSSPDTNYFCAKLPVFLAKRI